MNPIVAECVEKVKENPNEMSSEHLHSDLLLSNQLCFRLYTASRLIIKSYTPLLTKLGLTYPQYLVMMVLWEGRRMSVGEVARRLMLQTNTVTPLLKRIESMGLIEKSRGQEDLRHAYVELTAKGAELEETASKIPQTQVERLVCHGAGEELIPGISLRLDSLITVLRHLTGEATADEKDGYSSLTRG